MPSACSNGDTQAKTSSDSAHCCRGHRCLLPLGLHRQAVLHCCLRKHKADGKRAGVAGSSPLADLLQNLLKSQEGREALQEGGEADKATGGGARPGSRRCPGGRCCRDALVTSGRAHGKGQGLSPWGHALCRVTLSTTEESWTLISHCCTGPQLLGRWADVTRPA